METARAKQRDYFVERFVHIKFARTTTRIGKGGRMRSWFHGEIMEVIVSEVNILDRNI